MIDTENLRNYGWTEDMIVSNQTRIHVSLVSVKKENINNKISQTKNINNLKIFATDKNRKH